MIRTAAEKDLPELIRMATRFFDSSGLNRFMELNEDCLSDSLMNLIRGDQGAVLIAESDGKTVGAAGGIVYPFYFADHMTGQELFWWIDEEHRGGGLAKALFQSLEQWAKDSGADSFMMIALEESEPERVGAMYRKAGYVPNEHTYIRRL